MRRVGSRWRKRKVRIGKEQVCSFCKGALQAELDDGLQVCGGCQAVFHRACIAELGNRCPTLGCERPLAVEAGAAEPGVAERRGMRPLDPRTVAERAASSSGARERAGAPPRTDPAVVVLALGMALGGVAGCARDFPDPLGAMAGLLLSIPIVLPLTALLWLVPARGRQERLAAGGAGAALVLLGTGLMAVVDLVIDGPNWALLVGPLVLTLCGFAGGVLLAGEHGSVVSPADEEP